MGKRRTSWEITAEILENANGISPTKLMYRVELNFKQLNRYLPPLQEKGMIEIGLAERRVGRRSRGRLLSECPRKNGHKTIQITPKGRQLLQKLREAKEKLREAKEMMK